MATEKVSLGPTTYLTETEHFAQYRRAAVASREIRYSRSGFEGYSFLRFRPKQQYAYTNVFDMRPLALLSMLLGLFTVVTGIVIATGGTSFASEMLPMLLALVGGVVLVILGLRLQTGWRPGIVLTTVVAGIIGGYFGYQWIAESATIYPSGIQTILAGLAVVLALVVSVQPKERKREF